MKKKKKRPTRNSGSCTQSEGASGGAGGRGQVAGLHPPPVAPGRAWWPGTRGAGPPDPSRVPFFQACSPVRHRSISFLIEL